MNKLLGKVEEGAKKLANHQVCFFSFSFFFLLVMLFMRLRRGMMMMLREARGIYVGKSSGFCFV